MPTELDRLRSVIRERLPRHHRLVATSTVLKSRKPYTLPDGATLHDNAIHIVDEVARVVLRANVDVAAYAEELGVIRDPSALGLVRLCDVIPGTVPSRMVRAREAIAAGLAPSARTISRETWLSPEDAKVLISREKEWIRRQRRRWGSAG